MSMTKADLLNAVKLAPVPFDGPGGFHCLLRPLTWGERRALFDWHKQHEATAGAGLELQARLITLAVSDESGAPLLEAADLDGFGLELVDALAAEVAKRNGLGGAPGKA